MVLFAVVRCDDGRDGYTWAAARKRNGNQNHKVEPYKVHYYIYILISRETGNEIECMERVRSLVMQERMA